MRFTSDVKEALNHKYSDMATELKQQGRDIISLCVGEPDMVTPAYIVEATYRALLDGKTHYSNAQGIKELRCAIAREVSAHYGCEYDDGEVMVAPGVKPASYFALSAILEPKDEVVIISPYYLSYPSNVALAEPEAVIRYVDLNQDLSLNKEALAAVVNAKTKCIMVNSPNNPCGGILSKDEVEFIGRLAIDNDCYILSDEVYDRLVYAGQDYYSFLSLEGIKERLIVVNGFSKSHAMTGWRLGYALANKKLVKKMALFAQQTITNTSTPIQYGALSIYEHPWDHLDDYNRSLQERMEFFHNEINKHPYFRGSLPHCSFYYWVDISSSGKNSIEFCDDLLAKTGIVATPGVTFGESWDGYIRFSIASPMAELKRAIEKLKDYR